MKKIILIIVSLCVTFSVSAGGYRVALQGQQAQGMGHTGVAMTNTAEVVFFNPAGMSSLDAEINMVGGVTLIDAEAKYQNQVANTSAKTDNPVGTPVALYYSRKHDEKISYGLGIYTPYGNTVEWEKDWVGSHLVNNIELKAIFIQPTVSYNINDKYSIGFGPVYVIGSVEFNRNLSTALVDASGARSNVTIKATGINAFGYNIGFLAKQTKQLAFGISYRSKIDLEARNESANFENIPTSLLAAFPDTTFNADLVLPAELTLGVAFSLNSKTVLAFDINRTYWGAYKNLDVFFNNSIGLSPNPRNYKDANIYRFGVQHNLDKKVTLRGGIYIDESPISAGFFTPETPRNDSIGYTAGASYKMSQQLEIDVSLLFLTFDEFNGSYDFYDQSGTTISFGGEYLSTVTTIGFGLNYTY